MKFCKETFFPFFFVSLLFLFNHPAAFSQVEKEVLDSLKSVLVSKKSADTLKVKVANDLASRYSIVNIDSLKYFADIALKLSSKLKNENEEAAAYRSLSYYLYSKGNIEESFGKIK